MQGRIEITDKHQGTYLSLLQLRKCLIEAANDATLTFSDGIDERRLVLALPRRDPEFEMPPQFERIYTGEVLVNPYNWQPKGSRKFCLHRRYQFIGTDQEKRCEIFRREKRGRLLSGLMAQARVLILHALIKNISLGTAGFPYALAGYVTEGFLLPCGSIYCELRFLALDGFAKRVMEKTRTLMVDRDDAVLLVFTGEPDELCE
jgi:hypothetical protein